MPTILDTIQQLANISLSIAVAISVLWIAKSFAALVRQEAR